MKKTLLAALAFVLVLATVLTGTALAADEDVQPKQVAEIKMVDAAHPIQVDGKMDEAYVDAKPLYLETAHSTAPGIYSYAVARFVWSPSENAVYCFVIVNDANIGQPRYNSDEGCIAPWESDSVELYVDFIEDGLAPEGWGTVAAGTKYKVGMQYRIDGYTGLPSCLLEEEANALSAAGKWALTGKKANVYNVTYQFNEATKKIENLVDSAMADDFGWGYSDDPTKIGWGRKRTECGYTVEFRIENVIDTLQAGRKVFFNLQVNDMYADVRDSGGAALLYFYNSTMCQKLAPYAARNRMYYDWLVLSDEVATNTKSYEVSDSVMYEMGMEDVSEGRAVETEPTELTQTEKKTWSRRPLSAGNQTPSGGNENQGGDTSGDNNNQGGGDNNNASGGCGSSITIGASVAMVAAVGLTSVFALRKKDEE